MDATPGMVVSGSVLTLLLSGNIFFIKRLVDKLEKTATSHEKTSSHVSKLTEAVSGMGDKLREIKADIKELRRIEIDVAAFAVILMVFPLFALVA